MGKRDTKPWFMTESECRQHEDDYKDHLDYLETQAILTEWNELEGR